VDFGFRKVGKCHRLKSVLLKNMNYVFLTSARSSNSMTCMTSCRVE